MRVLVTGAAGRIGRLLRPRMARPGRTLRLLDRLPMPPGDEEILVADMTDPEVMRDACRDVDAIVHLGAIATESTWDELRHVNIDGTRIMLEAAQEAGIRRLILASSIHAVGYHPRGDDDLPADVRIRPDTYYGVTKALLEAMGSLYADRFGLTVIALRIGACFPEPIWHLPDAWLSPDDCGRLMEACLTTDAPGFRTIWGISRNSRRWWSLAAGEEIGYHPQDDADEHLTGQPESPLRTVLGGRFVNLPLGVRSPSE